MNVGFNEVIFVKFPPVATHEKELISGELTPEKVYTSPGQSVIELPRPVTIAGLLLIVL